MMVNLKYAKIVYAEIEKYIRIQFHLKINTEILDKICMALNCDIGDICEITYDKNSRKEG